MLSLLDSISNTGWATWIREANTIWGYVTFLIFHTFGMILLVGISSAIALRTLGVASDLPIAPLKKYVPVMWIGLYINLFTGLVLFSLTGSEFVVNPDYWVKMVAVLSAVIAVKKLLAYLDDPAVAKAKPIPAKGRTLARVVIACWLVAVTAGRLTAYDFLVGWQSAIAVFITVVVIFPAVWYIAPGLFAIDRSAQ